MSEKDHVPIGIPRPTRLSSIDRSRELLPWVRAERLTSASLYWLPVNSFPIPSQQRHWLMGFLDLFVPVAHKEFGLRSEVFLQYKTIHPSLIDPFLKSSVELNPMMGLSLRPGAGLPEIPAIEDMQPIIDGRKKFDFNEFVGDYCYWFLDKSEKRQRELFLGYGGLTTMFLKPDPRTQARPLPFTQAQRKHPVFQEFDIDRIWTQMNALSDGFQQKSKDLFGSGLKEDPQFKGLLFILPLLCTADFFDQPAEETEKWFQLFDIYINESIRDKGVLLASKCDLDDTLVRIVRAMRDKGTHYSNI